MQARLQSAALHINRRDSAQTLRRIDIAGLNAAQPRANGDVHSALQRCCGMEIR